MAKFLTLGTDGRLAEDQSAGAGGVPNANKIPNLDANGKLVESMLPDGIGADTTVVPASENLAQYDLINLWNDAGTIKVRKADAGTNQYQAHGYVKSAVTLGNDAVVYLDGTCGGTFAATDVGKPVFVSEVPGGVTLTPVSGSGKMHQCCGTVISISGFDFELAQPISLV